MKDRDITRGQAELLERLASGWTLRYVYPKSNKTNSVRWIWTDPKGAQHPLGDVQPHNCIRRGLCMWSKDSDEIKLTRRGVALALGVAAGEVKVRTLGPHAPHKPKPKAKPKPKKKVSRRGSFARQGMVAAAGKCPEHKTRRVRCECGVVFCQTCEPELTTQCKLCRPGGGDDQFRALNRRFPVLRVQDAEPAANGGAALADAPPPKPTIENGQGSGRVKSLGLVLCRREGERIFIGPDIVVEVVETFGTKVRLAISAPEDVIILREELAERVRAGRPPAGLREDDLDHR